MFKFSVLGDTIKRAEAGIKKQILTVLADPQVIDECGTTVVERIKYQARIKKPINETGGFPALAKSTVVYRMYLLKYNTPQPTAEASRSNITLTGAFLDSLTYSYLAPGEISIYFAGQHPRYRGKQGQPIGRELSNETLLGYLREKGFDPFSGPQLNANRPLKSRLATIVKAALRRSLRTS